MKLKISLLATSILSIVNSAHAQDFNNIVFFGDSLSDSGYFTNYNAQLGKFTTNPDQVWTQVLAETYGLEAVANSNGVDGNNYAAGGATVSDDFVHPLLGIYVPSAQTQVDDYLSDQQVDGNALYSVWIGANDFLNIEDATTAVSTMTTAATNAASIIQQLSDAGANYILVPNIPDIGLSPYATSEGITASASDLANYYNQTLYSALNEGSANVIPLDTYTLLQEIVANPDDYGLINVTGPACGFDDSGEMNSSITCYENTLPVNSNVYLFADGVHPTGTTHAILAQYAQSVLDAPSQFAQVSNIAKQAGYAQNWQLHRRLNHIETGTNGVWAEGEFNQYNGDDIESDGTNINGIIGGGLALDDKSQTGIYLQRKQGDYTAGSASNFELKETGFGVYHKHDIKDYELNLHAGIDKLDFDWERHINLGEATRTHTADGAGRRHHLAIEVGKAFDNGHLHYTPYVGVLAQKTRINTLVENNGDSATAMLFDSYDQDNLLGQLGIKADYAINDKYSLNGDIRYSHDFKDTDNEVTANLQSVNASYARGFSLPVSTTDGNNLALSLGVDANLTKVVSLQAGATATGLDSDDYQAGAYLGVNASF